MWDSGVDETKRGLTGALGALESRALVPRLGPFLERVVGRVRLRRVIANHESRHGSDPRAVVLRRLYEAALAGEYAGGTPKGAEVQSQLDREIGDDPAESLLMPIDHPSCYGNDPDVDKAVRPVLEAARTRLGSDYPRAKWLRFVDVVVFVVQITPGHPRLSP